MSNNDIYLGNPLLKKANVQHEFTEEQFLEFLKCQENPVYFAKKYIKIVHVDYGLVPFEMWPFQEKLVKNFYSNRFNICLMPRQVGKSTTAVSYLLHYIIFNDNVNIGILANKATISRELLGRLQLSYENLPRWMQHGVVSWNKGSVELDNGSKIIAASTSASAVRGMTFNIIFLDEFAFVPNHIADDFFASVYPTISSGKSTKVIIVSCVTDDTFVLTPKGIYEMSDFIDYNKEENPVKGYEVNDYQVYGHKGVNNGNILVNSGFHDTKIIYSPSSFVECSLRHPWFVCDNGVYDWKRTSNLTGDEYIAIEYGHDVWDNDNYIPKVDYDKFRTTIKKFDLNEITPDFAYFLGLYIAEGSSIYRVNNKNEIVYRGITITCGDYVGEVLDKLNLNYSCKDDLHYTISSTSLCEVMMNLGFDLSKTAKEKEIPKRLFRMSRDNIIALIQGIMDGDGSSQKNKGTISICSTSKKLIKQLRTLLNNFGILSIYGEMISKPTKKVKVFSQQYRIELSSEMSKKYYNTVGFRFNRKQINEKFLVEKITRNSYDIIPYSKELIFSLKQTHPDDYRKIVNSKILKGNYRTSPHLSRTFFLKNKEFLLSLNNERINVLYEYVSENVKWEKISKIENSQNKVYDFSLKETGDKWCHSVLFNNIVGSNTPKGMNHFYRMWHDAEKGKNNFIPTEVHWSEVPGRDEEWKRQTIANTSEDQFRAEHLCEFLGSVDTLIAPSKLKSLVYEAPLTRNAGLDIYEKPQKNHDYLITVDVARGVGKDYSAFTIIDITCFPHKLVGKYRDNQIKPMMFPNFIHEAANAYNKAFILCEVNDVGDQVASILQYDLEYSNLLMCSMRGRAGQVVGQGFSGKKTQLGLKMSKTVKKVGCLNLKTLIEEDKLFINDYEVISELTTFIQKHNSFEAEEGCNDDLAICLVLYSWLVAQDYFKELTNQDIRQKLYDEMENELEQDMAPFGFLSDGLDDNTFIDADGDRWFLDEYGDRSTEVSYSYMWDYI
jgi:intein/homing endonuclease